METESNHLQRVLASLRRNERRSPLFHWLAEHHDEIQEAAAGERIDWLTAVERFKEAGLTDATGKPATPRTARETWYQVRKVITARLSGLPGPRSVKVMPSKMSKDERPAVAAGPAPVPVMPARAAVAWPVGQTQSQSGPARDRRLTAAERTERLKQQLESRKY